MFHQKSCLSIGTDVRNTGDARSLWWVCFTPDRAVKVEQHDSTRYWEASMLAE
jgi:hypothetical protein